jgi:hypothetical protein
MQSVTKQCAKILHQNSISATVQPFQAGFWQGLANDHAFLASVGKLPSDAK